MEAAVARGVTVRLLIFFLYPPPYILHAKHVSIDDSVAVIGSSNIDIRTSVVPSATEPGEALLMGVIVILCG